MKYALNRQKTKQPTYFLAFAMVVSGVTTLLAFSPTYAETPVSITCKDGKTVTAIRTSEAFTLEDYQAACKDHGGYEDTGPYLYETPSDDSDAGDTGSNTLQSGSTGGTGDGKKCTASFFGIPAWYKNMQDDSCAFKAPETGGQADAKKLVLMIALNIVQAGMVVVAYVTIFFLIKGGFGYITSAGSSEGMASAKKTITNAIIGLIIAILSASIVNAIAGAIT